MTDTKDLQQRLRSLSGGFEEWRVEDPKDGSYCLSLTRNDCASPEHECREWLAREKRERPAGMHSGYIVAHHRVKTAKDRALDEAADTIQTITAECDNLRAELDQLHRDHDSRGGMLELTRARRDELEAENDALRTAALAGAEALEYLGGTLYAQRFRDAVTGASEQQEKQG